MYHWTELFEGLREVHNSFRLHNLTYYSKTIGLCGTIFHNVFLTVLLFIFCSHFHLYSHGEFESIMTKQIEFFGGIFEVA